MKKVLLVAIVSLALFSSCSKDRTCTCTYNGATGTDVFEDTTKSEAKEMCQDYETVLKFGDPSASCKL